MLRRSVRRCGAACGTRSRLALGAATRVRRPDGALHALNFLALPDERGRYFAEDARTIHRLTAARDLLPWNDDARAGHGLLALGGVDFDRADDGGATAPLASLADDVATLRSNVADSLRVHFTALPQTAEEVRAITTLWRASGGEAPIERTGAEASETEFKRFAPGRRVLHLATHGFALGPGGGPALAGTRAVGAVIGANAPSGAVRRAALLPGLALAGANAPARASGEDGFLTAEEITSLDLTGVEWAVLSACETGLADPTAVEAIQGLHRAFRRAGLHTAIVSLWAVDDAATRSWMTRLYSARLLERRDTAESVREACRGLLREQRAAGRDTHPFHWAAFVASGDWR